MRSDIAKRSGIQVLKDVPLVVCSQRSSWELRVIDEYCNIKSWKKSSAAAAADAVWHDFESTNEKAGLVNDGSGKMRPRTIALSSSASESTWGSCKETNAFTEVQDALLRFLSYTARDVPTGFDDSVKRSIKWENTTGVDYTYGMSGGISLVEQDSALRGSLVPELVTANSDVSSVYSVDQGPVALRQFLQHGDNNKSSSVFLLDSSSCGSLASHLRGTSVTSLTSQSAPTARFFSPPANPYATSLWNTLNPTLHEDEYISKLNTKHSRLWAHVVQLAESEAEYNANLVAAARFAQHLGSQGASVSERLFGNVEELREVSDAFVVRCNEALQASKDAKEDSDPAETIQQLAEPFGSTAFRSAFRSYVRNLPAQQRLLHARPELSQEFSVWRQSKSKSVSPNLQGLLSRPLQRLGQYQQFLQNLGPAFSETVSRCKESLLELLDPKIESQDPDRLFEKSPEKTTEGDSVEGPGSTLAPFSVEKFSVFNSRFESAAHTDDVLAAPSSGAKSVHDFNIRKSKLDKLPDDKLALVNVVLSFKHKYEMLVGIESSVANFVASMEHKLVSDTKMIAGYGEAFLAALKPEIECRRQFYTEAAAAMKDSTKAVRRCLKQCDGVRNVLNENRRKKIQRHNEALLTKTKGSFRIRNQSGDRSGDSMMLVNTKLLETETALNTQIAESDKLILKELPIMLGHMDEFAEHICAKHLSTVQTLARLEAEHWYKCSQYHIVT